ncbi:MAG: DUF4124 domain-containing protein [Xanthomonadales bacterium]|nr:DUF4124 domain-containing protein [Xanthomonadales bacterium]
MKLSASKMWVMFAVLGLSAPASPTFAQAVFKCVDSSGEVTFQDSPCPTHAESETVEISENASTPPTRPMSLEQMIQAGPIQALTSAQPVLESAREDAAACREHVEVARNMQAPACEATRRAQAFISDYADYASMIVNHEVSYDNDERPRIDRIGMANRRIVNQFNESVVAINGLLAGN